MLSSLWYNDIMDKSNGGSYYQRHRKDIRGKQKEYWVKYKSTPQRRKSWNDFNQTPKGFYQVMKSNSRIKGREFNLTQKDFLEWYEIIEKVCFYCNIPQELYSKLELFYRPLKKRNNYPRLTIDRLDNNRPYEVGNLSLACSRCNFIKSNFFTAEEMQAIGKQYIRAKWEE